MKIRKINQNKPDSQRGSASILVIMLSLTLVVFGVFSMMAAHAGLAVARRHGEWNTKHHQVESEAAWAAAEIQHLSEVETAGLVHSMEDEADLSDLKKAIIEMIEGGIDKKKLPVIITESDLASGGAEVVFQAEINILPPPEDRNGFYGALQYKIDLTERVQPRVTVDKMAWKSMTEAFEYKEGIEFRDVEVEVQVE